MKERVYIETSIISYLTARDSRDVVQLAKRQLTREWWNRERFRYELVIGQPVLEEIQLGAPDAVERRLAAVEGLSILSLTIVAERLAEGLVKARLIPPNARVDAYHVSIAATHGVDFLTTWNCSHINNAHTLGRISELIMRSGYKPPVIVTPELLWKDKI